MFEDTPAHIEHRELDLNNNELVLYLRISVKHYDMGLTPEGLFLLYRQAGIQRPLFEFPLASGATASILFHVKRHNIIFENAETKQQYQNLNHLLCLLETTSALLGLDWIGSWVGSSPVQESSLELLELRNNPIA